MIHSDFVHLHVHTQYSLLDGACLLSRLIDKAKSFRMPALAITDHGNIFGAVEFYNKCRQAGIKPIIGVEAYIASGGRFSRNSSEKEKNYHIILLAKDETGYKNLIKLISISYLEGFYYKPRIDKDVLSEHSEGLIGLSACLKGEIPSLILENRLHAATAAADDYQQIFGKGNFFLEVMDNGIKEQQEVNRQLYLIGQDIKIPLVATNDVHYIEKEDAFAHEVLLCIQTQTTLSDPNRMRFSSDSFYFKSPSEMKNSFREIPQAIANTVEIAKRCNLELDFSQLHLPKFIPPQGLTPEEFLEKLVWSNLNIKYPQPSREVKERVEHELKIIKSTGFASYFLIVWDLVKYAREHDIPVGPGRGSAAGSIVSFLLNITEIDPIHYNLIFERFLNPERISMPDIDLDFCYEKRPLMLEYAAERYGRENVAQIITFGTMLSRAVVRDVGRVMDFTYSEVDRIAKLIPQELNMTLEKALAVNPELKSLYDNNERIRRLIDTAFRLEGLSRHASIHAAGVVISDKPLTEYVPLFKTSDNQITTGYDMGSLAKIGLLKMDFLGLRTLTVIEETVKIIARTRGFRLNVTQIPLDDKKTFQLLREGRTAGIFQLESPGMRDILKRISPSTFEDLITILALYRPGPIGSGMVDDYIQRKSGKKPIDYIHPWLEPILKDTYGIIVFQEQVMQIASVLAGFSFSQADLLRRAMGKKIPEVMEEQRKVFLEGCKRKGVSLRIGERVFNLIEYFAGYGFNKSHSTAYALVSFRTAFLKANFPVEFMAALLTSERNNTDKVVEYVQDAKLQGIKVLPPDINESFSNFTVTQKNGIRFGLLAVKNVGEASIEAIISERKKGGPFKSIFDFCRRLDSRAVNKKVVESLIKVGAMDSLGRRAQLMEALPKALEKNGRFSSSQQLSIFSQQDVASFSDESLPEVEEWPPEQILIFEKQLLGLYVSSHPLLVYKDVLTSLGVRKIKDILDMNYQSENTIAAIIEKVRLTTTRRTNELMAILKIEDETSSMEAFVFPQVFRSAKEYIKKGSILIIRGHVNIKEKYPKLIISTLFPLNDIYQHITSLVVHLDENSLNITSQLKDIFMKYQGKVPVYFQVRSSRSRLLKIKTAPDFHINPEPQFISEINRLLGEGRFNLTLA